MDTNDQRDPITGDIIDPAIRVHSALGPGLLESSYRICLAYELRKRGHQIATEKALPIRYDGIVMDTGYRIDMLVDESVLIEIKCVEKLIPLHEAQLLTYMKLSQIRVGLLINFNVMLLKNGLKRMVL